MEPTLFSTIEALPHPGTLPEKLMQVYEGLSNGTLYQTGGVIREAIPPSHRGRIFAHLYQHGLPDQMARVRWPQQLPQQVAQVQTLATVATTLSAVNLGVSIAGFAILARKIDGLSASIRSLEQAMDARLQGVESKLDRLEMKLNGVASLVRSGTEVVLADLDRLRQQIDWTVLTDLHACVESLRDIERGRQGGHGAGELAERIRRVRVYLIGCIDEQLANAEVEVVTPGALRARVLLFALAQALVAEAQAWRLAGETDVAARVLSEQLAVLRRIALRASLPFVEGQPALVGSAFTPSLAETLQDRLVVSLLLNRPQGDPMEKLRVEASTRWAECIETGPPRLRRLARNREELRRRTSVAVDLLYPIAEAESFVDGLSGEYALLAEQSVPREEWEETQVPANNPGLYIRALPEQKGQAA